MSQLLPERCRLTLLGEQHGPPPHSPTTPPGPDSAYSAYAFSPLPPDVGTQACGHQLTSSQKHPEAGGCKQLVLDGRRVGDVHVTREWVQPDQEPLM